MSEIIHYGSFDRGMAVVLGNGIKAVYFGTTPVPFENDKVYIATLNLSKPEDVIRREKLEQSKPFRLGKIRYIPSQEELEEAAKRKAEDIACAAMQADLQSGLYVLNLENLKHDQLVKLADKIGAFRKTVKGENSTPLALRNAIAGRLGIEIPYYSPPKAGKKSDELPVIDDVMEEKPKKKAKKG